MLTDKTGRPHEAIPQSKEAGTAAIELPGEKYELTMVLPVKDFGNVYLFADDGGGLNAPQARELLLNYEFARSRAAFVRRYVKAAQGAGVTFSKAMLERLDRGEAALRRASEAHETAARVGYSNESLSETMWAGEMAALERARYRIARQEAALGKLDAVKLDACLAAQDETGVRASMREGEALGVEGTPALFVEGERIGGALPQEQLWMVIDRALRAVGEQPPAATARPEGTAK